MGKPTGKKKVQEASRPNAKQSKPAERNPKALDEDTAIFISMSQELKEEGNKLFQKRDFEGAILKYEKAVKLLPKNHIDVAHLRTSMASCFMHFGISDYPRAISECNLALEVSPKFTKALLKRSKCYEALNSLDLAWRDVNIVLKLEPNNSTGLESYERVKKLMEEKGIPYEEKGISLDDYELQTDLQFGGALKNKAKSKKKSKDLGTKDFRNNKSQDRGILTKNFGNNKSQDRVIVTKDLENNKSHDRVIVPKDLGNNKSHDKVIVKDKVSVIKDKEVVSKVVEEEKKVVSKSIKEEKVVTKTVKFVFGDDIRCAQVPSNCGIGLLREIIRDRFPNLKTVLVKYRDQEGDLVTITTTDELRMAEASGDPQGSLRLYIVEVDADQEPAYEGLKNQNKVNLDDPKPGTTVNGKEENCEDIGSDSICIEDWIIQFARVFKNHVGIESDSYLNLHDIGMKLYSEALEDTVTCKDAQELFAIVADKFQEMTALALFNWGNVHMSRARKQVYLSEDGSRDSILAQIKAAYDWAQKEYLNAGRRYEEALRIKPDLFEGYLALGLQQFELAKLSWYNAIANNVASESGPSSEVLQIYNKAEDSVEQGVQLCEEMVEQRLNGLSKFDKYRDQLQKMGLDGLVKDISADETEEQAAKMKSQIYILWGTLLYERSIVEYKLGLPTWEECLEVAVEKFEIAGASPTDIAVMIKNHCSNEAALEGLGFKIEEIVQAWNEMYDAKQWQTGVPSFRLEPLLRRRAPKIHSILEHI